MTVTTRLRSIALSCSAVFALAAIPAAASAVPLSTNPFSPSSPFNLQVPPNAPVASNGSSLSGATLGVASDEYAPAVFISSPSDPQYTIHLTSGWGPNALEGKKVRINPAARRGNDADGQMTIVVPQEDIVISLYQADQGPSGSTWNASWGGIAPLSGSGGNRGDSIGGRESGISQLAGLITPDDVRRGIAAGPNGDLGHALALLHSQVSNSTYLFPAIRAGGNSSGGLYMGQRVFLDPSFDVNSLTFEGGALSNRFGRLVARTMQRYGAVVVTNSGGTGFQLVNPVSWTSIGQPNPWPALIGDPLSGYYNYAVRAIPPSRLRAMAPSGGNGVAPPAGATPAPVPAPSTGTRAPGNKVGAGKGRLKATAWATLLRRRVVRSRSQVYVALAVRSARVGKVSVGARHGKAGRKGLIRRSAKITSKRTTFMVVRVPVTPGKRATIKLVVSVKDMKGRVSVVRREILSVAARS